MTPDELTASALALGGGFDTPGYKYVLLDDALEAVTDAGRMALDVDKLADALERVDPVAFPVATDRENVNHYEYAKAVMREYGRSDDR